MKASCYNFFYSEEPDCALWNTKTGAFFRISSHEYDCLRGDGVESLDERRRMQFAGAGVLVPDGMDEIGDIVNMLLDARESSPLYFRILTTTDCNASCAYCYEKGIAASAMDAGCAQRTADFIIRRYRERESHVTLEWFGGEPLMNIPAISLICDKLSAAGVPFHSKIISNGLLLNSYLIDTAAHEWRTESVQLTIDSVGEEYDQLKGVPRGSFQRLISGINDLLQSGIRVRVRINDTGSGDAPKKVIKYLYRHFGNDRRLRIYLCPLYRNEKMPSRESMRRILRLEQELFRLGYEDEGLYYIFRPRRLRCFACSPGGHTIAPDGRIFNCSHVMDAKHCAGTVSCFDECSPQRLSYTKAPLSDECIACIFLPVCGGGCRSGELGTADVFQCFQYRSVIPEIMKLRLKNLK